MTLEVEDGSGKVNADALATLAYFKSYHDARGGDYSGYSDDQIEASIRRATAVLDGYSWQGLRSNGRAQALSWPRSGIVDSEGNGIDSDEIPDEIVDACCELALRELVTPGALTPDLTPGDAIKREKVGPMDVEYAMPATNASQARPQVSIIGPLINQFLKAGGGSSIAGSSYRV